MGTISAIPAFDDNYIWAWRRGSEALVVDPGEAAPVLRWLQQQDLQLRHILLTHHHPDHVGGVTELVRQTGARVHGHGADRHRLPPLDEAVHEGDRLTLLGGEFRVLATPGHTLGHICYHGEGLLFCGDTLFSAGCGRMFEGQPAQYLASLQKLAALPDTLAVCCAHEYTLGNIAFAAQLSPQDQALAGELARVRTLRAEGLASLPSQLGWERRYNPFLRCADADLAAALGCAGSEPAQVFAAMRKAKDGFRLS